MPIVAPAIAPLVASDDAFFAANDLLLRNPSIVNLLDGCALSLPCHAEGELPVGLMLWAAAMRDDAVLDAVARGRSGARPDPARRPPPRPRADMRVAVIGAGVIGVTTAYELGADGHDVTVFERRGTVAAESSFANAGLVAPGYVSPWSAPGMPGKVISHLWREHCAGALRRPARPRRRSAGCGAGGAPASPRPTAPTGRACIASPTSAATACTS